jgi:hypothetical protein
MTTMEPIDIECPECEGIDYVSFYIDYDREWISVMCDCMRCGAKFQINYRAVGIDIIGSNKEEREFKRKVKKAFFDLLKRDRDLRLRYDDLVSAECKHKELKEFMDYLLYTNPETFTDGLIPYDEKKDEYIADIIKDLCKSEI